MKKNQKQPILVNVGGLLYNLNNMRLNEVEDILKKQQHRIVEHNEAAKKYPPDKREKISMPFLKTLEETKVKIEDYIRITKTHNEFANGGAK